MCTFYLYLNKQTPWWRVRLEKLIVIQLVKNLTFYETWMFITVFTKPAIGPYLESAESGSLLNPVSFRSILIISYHLHLGLSCVLLLSGFWAKIFYAFLSFSTRMTRPAHPTLLDLKEKCDTLFFSFHIIYRASRINTRHFIWLLLFYDALSSYEFM